MRWNQCCVGSLLKNNFQGIYVVKDEKFGGDRFNYLDGDMKFKISFFLHLQIHL